MVAERAARGRRAALPSPPSLLSSRTTQVRGRALVEDEGRGLVAKADADAECEAARDEDELEAAKQSASAGAAF